MLSKIARKIGAHFKRAVNLVAWAPKAYKAGGYSTFNLAKLDYGKSLAGKRILVTGGGSGIGLAIAKKCLDQGARVLITGRNQAKIEEAKASLKNPNLFGLDWDVAVTSQLKTKLSQAKAIVGGEFDVLVNNAGVIETTQFPDVTEEAWDKIYSINSRGLFFLTQAVCKDWLSTKGARKIINISSQGGFVGATYPYRMSKWDIVGLTQGLAMKLAPNGILINGIAPGIVATDMQPDFKDNGDNIFCNLNPLKRLILPEEIAEVAAFLISDASNSITGQTIICDCGFVLK